MKANPDLIETDSTVILGAARQRLAFEALWELGALCEVLHGIASGTVTVDMALYAVRGVAVRMEALVAAATSALGDELDVTGDIANRVKIALPSQDGDG